MVDTVDAFHIAQRVMRSSEREFEDYGGGRTVTHAFNFWYAVVRQSVHSISMVFNLVSLVSNYGCIISTLWERSRADNFLD